MAIYTLFPGGQVEQAVFLSLMRLREKMGAVKTLPSAATVSGHDKRATTASALLKDSRRARRDGNIGDYTRNLWSSLGAGDTAASYADQPAARGFAGARGGAGDGIDVRPGGGQGLYWAGIENSNHVRLVTFAETIAAGESALSPGVFEVGGGRRAEVRMCALLCSFSFFFVSWVWVNALV